MLVIRYLASLQKRLARKGFAGPKYSGITGKLRFAIESKVARRERVFLLVPDEFHAVTIRKPTGFDVVQVRSPAALEPYRSALEQAWYPGLLESWKGPWSWGEKLYLGLLDGVPVSYNWLQQGTSSGHNVYWGRFFEGEYRILRGAVAPSWRGQGGNTAMKHAIFTELFAQGATRVYAECYANNIPSIRTLQALGFREIGQLTVLEIPGFRGFIRWSSASPLSAAAQQTRVPSHRP